MHTYLKKKYGKEETERCISGDIYMSIYTIVCARHTHGHSLIWHNNKSSQRCAQSDTRARVCVRAIFGIYSSNNTVVCQTRSRSRQEREREPTAVFNTSEWWHTHPWKVAKFNTKALHARFKRSNKKKKSVSSLIHSRNTYGVHTLCLRLQQITAAEKIQKERTNGNVKYENVLAEPLILCVCVYWISRIRE